MSRIEPWSTALTMLSLRPIHLPISGCISCPQTNGTNSCSTISPMVRQAEPDRRWLESTRLTTTGVTKMPMMLEAEALQTAAGTFPFAMAVKAIENWTVDGRVQRNRMPA
jgi:hypothetical protein